ncbi:PE-PGRS family protein [Streptomyces sp. NPDC050738]|uniref:PE-PGRS family protein n=1 Tax=Streptomyces sp. NPDC050738 TaxID=3154744 RepID=UPI00341CCDC2
MTGVSDGLRELLGRAGLEIAGDRRIEEVLPVRAAMRAVASMETEPTVAVRHDHPDPVAELNAQWHRLAVGNGVIGEDGVFLIAAGGDGGDSGNSGDGGDGWTRVRLTDGWDLAGVLGPRPGRPEFISLSLDGDRLLGATTEEYEVWLVAVDRIRERQEAAAEAAVRESAEEREGAWASLAGGLKPSKKLRGQWADGLALNPATPEDLLADLLGLTQYVMFRALPAAVVEAAIAHPEVKVREVLAEYNSHLTAEQWTRLILEERNERYRWMFTWIAADRRVDLPDIACEQLAADPSTRIRRQAVRLPGLPIRVLTALAADDDPSVRASVCSGAWHRLEGTVQQGLLDDSDDHVRIEALLQHHLVHPLSRSAFEAQELNNLAAKTCRLERGLAEHAARHEDLYLRRSLADNPHLDPDLVSLLAQDPDQGVRTTIASRPDITEELRAAIDFSFDPHTRYGPLRWVLALHDDPAAMRRLAASAHPLVRRSVARARRLPPDVVERLARDEDRVVQLFLAESCDDAPADMLLRVWQWWTGSFSFPDRPRGHPNFPRHGLLRYADDPNPRMRQLALDDPQSTAELVERFSRDDNADVRYRASSDPRLSPASAVRLLDDPHDRIRHAAARHPLLPARVLVGLLRDTGTARAAAQHPTVPQPVIRQLVQRLRPPAEVVPAP